MSKQPIEKLSVLLSSFIQEAIRIMVPISVETQITSPLYYSSDRGRREAVIDIGLAAPTISCVARKETQAISTEPSHFYIKEPKAEKDVQEAVHGFYQNYGFPQCIGAVDGKHIPITRPKENATDFIN